MTIEGVIVKHIDCHQSQGGFFTPILCVNDPFFPGFGQLSHSFIGKGTIKAWHLHKKQADVIYLITGKITLVLADLRPGSGTYKNVMVIPLDDQDNRKAVLVPAGVAHGYKVASKAQLLYLTSRKYDKADEIRLPAQTAQIPFYWKSLK